MISAGDAADPFIGLTISSSLRPDVKLRIERRLGEGGTAVAYFATRFGPDGISPVVVKVILPSIIAQAGETARMIVQKEAVALGRLNERVPLGDANARALTACTSLPERELGLAVGTDGAVVRVEHGRVDVA